MTDPLFNLWAKNKSQIVEAIAEIDTTAKMLGVSFFLIGATARDILCEQLKIVSQRMTRDIDLAFSVDSWEKFEAIRKGMLAGGKFTQNELPVHRFVHTRTGLLVDILPFGQIENPPGSVKWPFPESTVLSTLGFKDAFEHFITVRISSNPDLDLKVCNLAGLAIMKLIAWKDKYPQGDKHAKDLLFIMKEYLEIGHRDRLYDEHQDIAQAEDFDWESASARLLGRDIASMAGPDVLIKITAILDEETVVDSPNHLVRDMITHRFSDDKDFDEILHLVEQLKLGIADRRKI